jgi:hypothetical protein
MEEYKMYDHIKWYTMEPKEYECSKTSYGLYIF